MDSGIYLISNIVSGKVYVGKTLHFRQRWQQHRYTLRHNRHRNLHLQSAWNHYGEDSFTFEILCRCDAESLGLKETYYIAAFDSLNREKGYNLHEPTLDGGRIASDETRKRMSAAQTGRPCSEETRRKLRQAHTGKTLSVEHKQKMAESQKARWISKGVTRKPAKEIKPKAFSLFAPDGTLHHGSNLTDFAAKHKLIPSLVCKLVKGKRKSHKGWRLEGKGL